MVFKILDIVAAIGIITTLNLVQKYRIAWLGYAFAALLFTVVVASSKLYGQTGMGIVLVFTGIKNYISERKKMNTDKYDLALTPTLVLDLHNDWMKSIPYTLVAPNPARQKNPGWDVWGNEV